MFRRTLCLLHISVQRYGRGVEQESVVPVWPLLEKAVPSQLCCVASNQALSRSGEVKEGAQSRDLRVLRASLTFSKSKSCSELSCRTQEQPGFLVTDGFGLPSPKVFCFFKVNNFLNLDEFV